MTAREELDLYFLIRAQVWNDKLVVLDASVVASVVKTLKSVRADVRRQLLDNADMLSGCGGEDMTLKPNHTTLRRGPSRRFGLGMKCIKTQTYTGCSRHCLSRTRFQKYKPKK